MSKLGGQTAPLDDDGAMVVIAMGLVPGAGERATVDGLSQVE